MAVVLLLSWQMKQWVLCPSGDRYVNSISRRYCLKPNPALYFKQHTQISMQPTLYTWYQTLSRLLYWPLSKQRDGGYHWQCLHLVIHSRGPHGFKLLSISDDISPCGFVNGRNLTPPSSQFGYHTVEFINPFIFSPLLVSFRYSEDLDRPMTPFVHQRIAWRQVRSTSTDWLFTSVSHVLVTG